MREEVGVASRSFCFLFLVVLACSGTLGLESSGIYAQLDLHTSSLRSTFGYRSSPYESSREELLEIPKSRRVSNLERTCELAADTVLSSPLFAFPSNAK